MTVSAPGKVILHGEHAVVHGRKAVALSLDLRTTLTISTTQNHKLQLCMPDIGVDVSWRTDELQMLRSKIMNGSSGILSTESKDVKVLPEPSKPNDAAAEHLRTFIMDCLSGRSIDEQSSCGQGVISVLYLLLVLTSRDGQVPSLQLRFNTCLPISAGLGSSAAFATCLSAGLLCYTGAIPIPANEKTGVHAWSDKEHQKLINQWSFVAEQVIHGRPSGIDNSVSVHGGGLVFQAGHITPLTQVPEIHILLVNTKVPRCTKTLVAGVKQRYDTMPAVMTPIFDAIEAVTEHSISLLTSTRTGCDSETLGELVRVNHCLLKAIGRMHEENSLESPSKVIASF